MSAIMARDSQGSSHHLKVVGGAYGKRKDLIYEENVLQNENDYRTNGFGNLKYAMGNVKRTFAIRFATCS